MDEFNEILSVEGLPLSQRSIFPKRQARIDEAKSWEIGTPEERKFYTIWKNEEYSISLGKPGKEATTEYRGTQNPDDMKPSIFFRGENLQKSATFQDVVKDLEEVGKVSKYALELLGCLIFRSAFLLDHKTVEGGEEEGKYRYFPNQAVVNKIAEFVPIVYGVPTEVFLHYLDAIALNEDVKYSSRYDLSKKDVGGRNNLLTYVNLIAVILGKKGLHTLAGPLLKSGVSAIGQKVAISCLPHLSEDSPQPNQ
jgi:hypothetical protein